MRVIYVRLLISGIALAALVASAMMDPAAVPQTAVLPLSSGQ